MAGRQLVFQPPKFDWHAGDWQQAFDEWKGQITLVLCASSINRDIWFATIIGYLGKEGFKRYSNRYPQMRRLRRTQRKSSKPSQTLSKSQPHTGITSTRYTVTLNKVTMSQLTNLIRELRTSLKDASTRQMRSWYIELNFYFMRPNTSR